MRELCTMLSTIPSISVISVMLYIFCSVHEYVSNISFLLYIFSHVFWAFPLVGEFREQLKQ